MVEHFPDAKDVTGSNPVTRTDSVCVWSSMVGVDEDLGDCGCSRTRTDCTWVCKPGFVGFNSTPGMPFRVRNRGRGRR